jgi:hypothetical protein
LNQKARIAEARTLVEGVSRFTPLLRAGFCTDARNLEQMRIEWMEEKIKTPQTPRRRVFLFVLSQRLCVSALKTAFPFI